MKELRVIKAGRGLISYLAEYIIVNSFLIFINLWTAPDTLWLPSRDGASA